MHVYVAVDGNLPPFNVVTAPFEGAVTVGHATADKSASLMVYHILTMTNRLMSMPQQTKEKKEHIFWTEPRHSGVTIVSG